ncbi:hypothetical protein BG011_007376 [Mortierella polycephala]|uniref:Uncharacterized protein n=1 Tax=Mortierella polycephala TaxID=41804 RepID=A0A9P6PQ98_9FUNG|nr:hypothetical protein BG011_007376 [Mortierella polycephala]
MSTNSSSDINLENNMDQPTMYSHHNQQYPETSTGPATTTVPQQFDQTYQQYFFSQSEITGQDQNDTPFQSTMTTAPINHSLNTDAGGNGSLGHHVGGGGIPRAQAMPPAHPASTQQQQQPLPGVDAKAEGKLESVQQASASHPSAGSFDLSEPDSRGSGTTSITTSAIPDHTNLHPKHEEQEDPMRGRTTGRLFNTTFNAATGERLDPAMTSRDPTISAAETTKTHNAQNASDDVITAAHAGHAADAATHERRRSPLVALVDRIRSASRSRSRSRSRSQPRSPSLTRRLSRSLSRHSLDEEDEEEEASGPYKEVKKAQREYLKNLRAEQERQGIIHDWEEEDDYYGGRLGTNHTDNDEDADDSLNQQECLDQSALPMTLNQYADFVRQLTFYGILPIHADQTFPNLEALAIHPSFSASGIHFENDHCSKLLLRHPSITHLVLYNVYIPRSIQLWAAVHHGLKSLRSMTLVNMLVPKNGTVLA